MLNKYCPEKSKYDHLIPLCYPHYKIENDKLIFMNFRKKKVEPHLLSVLKKVDGISTVEEIVKNNREITVESLLALEENKIITFYHPSSFTDQERTKNIVILSPHADDASFSLGGSLWKYRNRANIHIINIFTRQDFTIYWKLYAESREKNFVHHEERMAWKLLNIKDGKMLGLKDAPMREKYKDQVILSEEFDSSKIISNEQKLYQQLTTSIGEIIKNINPSIILCPLGIGKHVDHILVRDACIEAVKDYRRLSFYEEMPYVISFNRETVIKEVEEKVKRKLVSRKIDITSSVEMKLKVLNIYKSQIKSFQAKAMVQHSYQSSSCFENIWRVEE